MGYRQWDEACPECKREVLRQQLILEGKVKEFVSPVDRYMREYTMRQYIENQKKPK